MQYKTVFILSDVRCGSTYAAELISYNFAKYLDFEIWDVAREVFQALGDESNSSDVATLHGNLWVNPQGWRGAMVKCGHMSRMIKLADQDPSVQHLLFGPSAYWIVIRRSDIFARAVSLAHAEASGRYHVYSGSGTPGSDYRVSLESLRDCLGAVAIADYFISACIPQLKNVIEIEYDNIRADERRFVNTIGEFLLRQKVVADDQMIIEPKLTIDHADRKLKDRDNFIKWFVRQFFKENIEKSGQTP